MAERDNDQQPHIRTAAQERADVIACLERRRRGCLQVAEKSVEFADEARVMLRQLDVILGDLRAGLHEGEAEALELIGESAE